MRPSPLLNTQARPGQIQGFAPRLQHAVRLLNMSSLDYAQALMEESAHNPFLEVDASALDAADEGSERAAEERAEALSWASPGSQRPRPDAELDSAALLTRPLGLREHLHAQLGVLRLAPEELARAHAVVDCLDDDGLLRSTLDELAAWEAAACSEAEIDIDAHGGTAQHWQLALRRVQSLDPCGVGARDLRECLLLQAEQLSDSHCRALVQRILQEHLPLLARGDMKQLARHSGASPAAVAQAACAIRRMQPKPGAAFMQDLAPCVVPEVRVQRQGRRWVASLNEAAFPRLKLDTSLADWAHQPRAQVPREARELLERAQWSVQNLRQRSHTILAVAEEIVARQSLFFEHGAFALKPMEMREIAKRLGMHASTVSRVVHNKFMVTPLGTFELRHFFARGTTPNGAVANCAPVALQALLRSIVEAEPPQRPHSDVQLAKLLAQQGFALARRTVTKYRQALRIESVEKRRLTALGG